MADRYDLIGSTLRYLVYVVIITIFARQYFNVKFGMRVYRAICVFAALFIIFQTICMALFNFYPKGVIKSSLFPQVREEMNTFGDILPIVGKFSRFRPRSIFAEPAHFSSYVAGYLAISLFNKQKELPVQLALTAGLLLSMSSTGILVGTFVWGLYFFDIAKNGLSRMKFIIFFVVVIVGIIVIVRSSFFQYFIYRFTSTRSTSDRFSAYSVLEDYFKGSPMYLLFGYGHNGRDQLTYTAGFPKLLISYGLVGTLCFAISCIELFIKGTTIQKKLLIVFLIFQLGTEFLFGVLELCFLPFILASPDRVREYCCQQLRPSDMSQQDSSY